VVTFLKRETMKKIIIVSILILILGLFSSLSIGDEQTDERDNVALESMTVEVMVDQLEKMPRVTDDERNAWALFSFSVEQEFAKLITYETRDNLDLWELVGRWATAKVDSLSETSPYANAPFFHIQRLQPDYQKDEKLLRLMAKLNAIRNKKHQSLEVNGYHDFVYLFEKCDTNSPQIQLKIGRAYEEGYGLWENSTESAKWFKRAAQNGDAESIGELGEAYVRGNGVEKNVETGLKLLNKAVEMGSAKAAYSIGSYYQPGFFSGEHSNKEKAIEMFRIAAERDYSDAFIRLAEIYLQVGNGTEAIRWANGGDEPDPNNKTEHQRWQRNRSRADSRGLCSYYKGKVYALGIGEIEQDLARAKELFEESCQHNSIPFGAEALSAMYKEGFGVEADRNLAKQWRSKAIDLWLTLPDAEQQADSNISKFAKKIRKVSTR